MRLMFPPVDLTHPVVPDEEISAAAAAITGEGAAELEAELVVVEEEGSFPVATEGRVEAAPAVAVGAEITSFLFREEACGLLTL
jgi:hypothetical protein